MSFKRKKTNPAGNLITAPVPQSQVLGKVKDFLGLISEANERLQLDAKDKSENYDIEVLTGQDSQAIEMDLMLGIADLHTPEAVAAAESAIAGYQPLIPLAESEDSSYEDDDYNEHDVKPSSIKLKRSQSAKNNSSNDAGKNMFKRLPKIVDMDIC